MAVTSQSKRVGVRDQSIIASDLCRHIYSTLDDDDDGDGLAQKSEPENAES